MIFVTNFDKCRLDHFLLSAKGANLNIIIKEDAYDANDNKLPNDTFAMYVEDVDYNSHEFIMFWEYNRYLQEEYKSFLIRNNYITQEFADSHWCYVGCEKEYGITLKQNTIC